MTDNGYNGWTDRATWNVAIWLDQDFEEEIAEMRRDRKWVDSPRKFREALQSMLWELECEGWYLKPLQKGSEPIHFATPDGEWFRDANWDELYNQLIAEPRDEVSK
jgi:hypothetical protein